MYPRDITDALKTLGFADGVAPKSLKELNKRYHLLALRHHPDKASDSGSGASNDVVFKQINHAHKQVKAYFYSDIDSPNDDEGNNAGDGSGSYDSIFQLFIKTILVKISGGTSGVNSDAIHSIIRSILNKGIQSSVLLFRKMDKSSCMMIYDILSTNQELFSISREIMDELTSIVDEKTRYDIVIRLNPSLLDMLLDRVYILNECGQTYYIPLWHSELHFKQPVPLVSTGTGPGHDPGPGPYPDADADADLESEPESSLNTREIIVLCEPELPDHVAIDENNNIYVSLDVNICELFRDQVIPVYITDEIKKHGIVYYLHARYVSLQSKTRQCILLDGCGIAICRHNHTTMAVSGGSSDIYKVVERANVYAVVKLISESN